MKKEDLLRLTVDELSDMVLTLEKKAAEEKKSSDHWYAERNAVTAKFNNFRDAIKGLVYLID